MLILETLFWKSWTDACTLAPQQQFDAEHHSEFSSQVWLTQYLNNQNHPYNNGEITGALIDQKLEKFVNLRLVMYKTFLLFSQHPKCMGDYADKLIESAVYLLFTYEEYIRNWPREGYFQLTELVSS